MKEKLLRIDDKIRNQFVILSKTDGVIIAKGHIYEQRNVSLTEKFGQDISEQYSSLDAMLQTLRDVRTIEFM